MGKWGGQEEREGEIFKKKLFNIISWRTKIKLVYKFKDHFDKRKSQFINILIQIDGFNQIDDNIDRI